MEKLVNKLNEAAKNYHDQRKTPVDDVACGM